MHDGNPNHDEGFCSKLRRSRYFMALICIVPVLLIFAGSYILGLKNSSLLFFALMAACIIGHMLMMKNHNH